MRIDCWFVVFLKPLPSPLFMTRLHLVLLLHLAWVCFTFVLAYVDWRSCDRLPKFHFLKLVIFHIRLYMNS